MNWESIAKALTDGIAGLILRMMGIMAGCGAVIGILSYGFPRPPAGGAVGIDVLFILRSGVFWSIVLA